MKKLIGYFKRTNSILKEARGKNKNGFKDLNKERDTLAADNGICDVDGSEILKINAGGGIISMTRDALTQIKLTRLKAMFYRR